MPRRSQLRIYALDPVTADEFVAGFHEHLVPLRARFGFSLDGAWLSEDRTRFAWVTSHDGPEGFEAAEAAYYASPERVSVPFQPVPYISSMDISMVAATA
jgi:hypothetical protein